MNETADKFDFAATELNAAREEPDETLVALARAGDESAFEKLFERHRRQVARVAGRFFNRPEHVEEVVQEVFTKLYFALDSYSAERGTAFAAWLSRITINSCYDHLRRARRRPESAIENINEAEGAWLRRRVRDQGRGSDAESALISRDLASKLLARLGADDRLVLTLMEIEDRSVAEIADVTGWSVAKVKVRAHRARASLRRLFDQFK
jgi:RNA polymerase sigma-70 factor, ECF subfamily